ncbi:MAG: thiosulfate oxidation carrier complex protein SoxZ [Campylobacterales bacterium]|nr:thiosulfate oxidation carrier complex protein SoxZ [Campylobacterales bacterium]
MANKISAIKLKIKDDVATAKMAISHPMTTYAQAESLTGSKDDANFITHITGKVGEEVVLDISTSQFFSKNPIFMFQFKCDTFKVGKKLSGRELDSGIERKASEIGDFLTVVVTDRKGNTYEKSEELTSTKS